MSESDLTKRASRRDRGQEALEFALIFPILFLVLMGIYDLGRATYYASMLHNAAREGARYGVIFPDDVAGIEATVDNLAVGVPLEALVVTVTADDDFIHVTVAYDMPIVTPLIGAFLGRGNALPLTSESTMRIEQ